MPGGQSGNGWVTCAQGHRHWGLYGAAGVLAYVPHPADQALSLVLVQRRARWAHQGGTWALPGGAMDSEETPAEAALREADEECGLDPKLVVPRGMYTDDHGGWAYHTVLAQAAEPLRVSSDGYESDETVWLPASEVGGLGLHPGFAASWPVLREALAPLIIVVDGTGRRGTAGGDDGAADAGRRLYEHVSALTRSGLAAPPDGVPGPLLARWYPDYVLLLGEAAATAARHAATDAAAQAAAQAPRFGWNAPIAVRAAAIRIVAVADGNQADRAIDGLAEISPGHRLVVSGERIYRLH